MYNNLSLLDWQNRCSAGLLEGDKNSSVLSKGLSIYKSSITAIHHNALTLSFPVLKELLGTRIFSLVANDYIKYKNWRSPSLDEFGHDLSEFVNHHQQLSSMPYLGEVVAIEWVVQSMGECHVSAPDLDLQLNSLLTSSHDIEIRTKPNVDFIQSEHGGIETWMAHQTEIVGEVNLDEVKPSHWYLMRTADGFSADAISLGLYEIATSIKNGGSMTDLCEQEGIEIALGYLKTLLVNQLISFHASERNKNVQ